MRSPGNGVVSVLGGGISGLSAAYRLTQIQPSPKRIVLFEAGSRVGGWMHSSRLEDGVIYEHGPRTIRPAGESGITTLNLVHELGLGEQVMNVPFGHPSSRNRYVYADSRLIRLPTELSTFFKTKAPFKKPLIVAGFRDLFTRKSSEKDESMFDFVSRRLGPDLAEFAIDPLVRGVCAGDSKEVSVNFLLRTLKEAEQNYGRITIGLLASALRKTPPSKSPVSELAKKARLERWPVWSLQGGLQSLPETLAEKTASAGAEVFTESPCTGLEFRQDGSVVVKCNEEELHSSRVISALPAFKLAELLESSHPQLADMLKTIECVTVGLVNIEWSGQKLNQEAFGFLVPSSQKLPILGVVYDTCSFPQGDKTIVTVMMGGKWFESLFGVDPTEQTLLNVALQQIESVLGIKEAPRRSQVHILRKCIPQYIVGHYDVVKNIRRYITENKLALDLTGASFDGVSVNDCVHNAFKAAEESMLKNSG
nr:EOG090X06SP [Scapholeberis mucronata]